jgi:F0F1-type ATP synthase membrane subunit b/b'
MLKDAEQIGITNKATIAALLATFGNSIASTITWVNENLLSMSQAAAFVLTIVLIFKYIIESIRSSRSSRIEDIKKELEIEKLRREIELLEDK